MPYTRNYRDMPEPFQFDGLLSARVANLAE
jgi:hypothetical protein